MASPEIHTITHWKRKGVNEFNETSFSNPVEVIGFWIDDETRIEDNEGRIIVGTSRILMNDRVFEIGDRVQFSPLSGARLTDSYIVRGRKFVENRFQTSRLHQAILTR